jgi:hypothetical protein
MNPFRVVPAAPGSVTSEANSPDSLIAGPENPNDRMDESPFCEIKVNGTRGSARAVAAHAASTQGIQVR